MTKEEERLLLEDLSGRLSCGVIIQVYFEDISADGYFDEELWSLELDGESARVNDRRIENIKPYLRSMSSMTKEEKEELKHEHIKDEKLYAECLTRAANGDDSMRGKVIPHFAADWCNKNHFDFRGLIPMGLALEAPEDMYKTE